MAFGDHGLWGGIYGLHDKWSYRVSASLDDALLFFNRNAYLSNLLPGTGYTYT